MQHVQVQVTVAYKYKCGVVVQVGLLSGRFQKKVCCWLLQSLSLAFAFNGKQCKQKKTRQRLRCNEQ